jgi:hypothetical protein
MNFWMHPLNRELSEVPATRLSDTRTGRERLSIPPAGSSSKAGIDEERYLVGRQESAEIAKNWTILKSYSHALFSLDEIRNDTTV